MTGKGIWAVAGIALICITIVAVAAIRGAMSRPVNLTVRVKVIPHRCGEGEATDVLPAGAEIVLPRVNPDDGEEK